MQPAGAPPLPAGVRVISRASARFTASSDLDATLRQVAQAFVGELAEWCTLDLFDEGRLTRRAVAHADPKRAEIALAEQGARPTTVPDAAFRQLREGRTLVLDGAPAIAEIAADPAQRATLATLGLSACVLAPLAGPEGCLGALVVARDRPFATEETAAITELARRAGAAIDRSKLMEALRLSEERYRSLVQAMANIVWITTPDGEVDDMPSWRAFTGQTAAQVKGRGWTEAIHAEDRGVFLRAWGEAIAMRTSFATECRVRAADGGYRHFLARGAPVLDSDGNVREWVGVMLDTTEQKAVETRLRESEHRYMQILDSVHELVYTKAPGSRVTYVNKALAEHRGRPKEQLVGVVDVSEIREEARVFSRGDTVELEEERLVRSDGQERVFHTVETPIFDTHGRVVELVGVSRDITERLRAEALLRAQKAILESQVEAIPDGLLVVAPDGRTLSYNQRFLDTWGIERPVVDAGHGALMDSLRSKLADPTALAGGLSGGDHVAHDTVLLADARVLERYTAPIHGTTGGAPGRLWVFRDVTERKRTEETLSRLLLEVESQRKRLDSIIASVPGVVWEAYVAADAGGQQNDFVSEHVERMLGYSAQEWLATPRFWLSIVHPDDRERTAREIEDLFESGKGGTLEFRWRRKDGDYLWAQAWTAVVRDDLGRPIGMRGVTMDVTARKLAEDSLRESETRYRFLAEHSRDIISRSTPEGKSTYVSSAIERILGYSPQEFLAMDGWALVHSDDAARVRREFEAGFHHPDAYTLTMRYRRKDGVYVWLEAAVQTVRDSRGEPIEVVAASRDVTERKMAELALQASEARYRFLADAVPSQVWTATPDGRIDYVNGRVLEYFGARVETLLGEGWMGHIHPDEVEGASERWERARSIGEVYEDELRLRRADGSWRSHLIRAAPLKDDAGRVVKWFGASADIEEFKQLVRELDQFAYVASHDLKAPLRGIANLSRWIEEDLGDKLQGETKEHLDLLRGRVNRMEALIDAILQYSRVGRARIEPEPVDVGALVRDCVDLLSLPDHFRVEVAPGMPTLHTQKLQLQQVFMNLISNAAKHHHDPSKGIVRVVAEDQGDHWRFTVADNGPGIDPRFHERVFVLFQTLQPRDKVEGTGIGLALVKKIVNHQGGAISLESAEGVGAAFHFTWPKVSP